MRKITVLLALLAVIVSCTTIDCPLNNSVYARYRLAGDVTTLGDTLTISTTRTAGSDTVLLNKALGVDSFNLPLSYQHAQDVFYIDIRPQGAARKSVREARAPRNPKRESRGRFRRGFRPATHRQGGMSTARPRDSARRRTSAGRSPTCWSRRCR